MDNQPPSNPPSDKEVGANQHREDELDKDQIQQLHGMLLQVANNCFEIKKLCATTLVAVATLVATFGNKQIRPAIFPGGLVVVALFWFTDTQSYYYQEKIRARMKQLQQRRVERADLAYGVDGVGMQFTARRSTPGRILRSMLNQSMLYYAVLAVLVGLLWAASGVVLR